MIVFMEPAGQPAGSFIRVGEACRPIPRQTAEIPSTVLPDAFWPPHQRKQRHNRLAS